MKGDGMTVEKKGNGEVLRDLVGYGSQTPRVEWPDQAKVAVNIVVNYEEGSEYSYWAGDSRNESLGEISYKIGPAYRDLSVESTYEYGSRAGIWRLVRLFDEYDVPCTFYACAVALEQNSEVAGYLRESSHDFVSHGWRWEEHWLLDRETEKEHIKLAVESFRRTLGDRPIGWYCRYGPSVNTRELVVDEGGFLYDCDAYNDDLPYFTRVSGKEHLVVPYSLTYNDLQGDKSPDDFADFCTRAIDELWLEGDRGYPKMMSVGLHPRLAGQAGRASALREIIRHGLGKGGVWFARRDDIARWWMEHWSEFEGRR
jgi:peptidoglycan/xylan/chitin deacetylase (PgdA/CDA1 family)